MRCLAFLLLASTLFVPSVAWAAELQRIVLDDGTEIVAEVRSLEGGIYTLQSPSLGEVRVPQRKVERIVPQGSSSTPRAKAPANPALRSEEIQDLQLRMLSNPATLDTLMELHSSPEMQAVLSDPEILRAVAAGDLDALSRNPKMQELMNDPAIRRLTEELSGAP
ncbi:MAG: hypothetical protein QNK05_15845 [Myxococcota bacterium]|nr:hypothetical protein [Myxococcota bacterium]